MQVPNKKAAETVKIKRLDPAERIEDYFTMDEVLFDGGERSKVLSGIRKSDGQEIVVKARYKKKFNGGELVWRCVLERFMNMEQHEHVLGIQQILEDEEAYYVVMEHCEGGELYHFLLTETDVPEIECKRLMREILQAVQHLHLKGLVHRDIKPENILLVTSPKKTPGLRISSPTKTPGVLSAAESGSPKSVKLIDFDTIQEWDPTTPKANRIVGTPGYIAPEAYLGDYSPASDLWSIGVIFYIFMTGTMPFGEEVYGRPEDLSKEGSNLIGSDVLRDVHSKLNNTTVDWECQPWPEFPLARDLCQRLLEPSPDSRSVSAHDALCHPWFTTND